MNRQNALLVGKVPTQTISIEKLVAELGLPLPLTSANGVLQSLKP